MKGHAYAPSIVRDVQRLMALRKTASFNGTRSVAAIQKAVGIGSRTTLYRICKRSNTQEAVRQRRLRKAHNRLLTVHQEMVLGGLICVRSDLHFDTSSNYIITMARELFGVKVSARWVHDFAKRNQLSSRTAHGKENVLEDNDDVREMENFLKRVRARKKRPEQIACLDKTGVYGTAIYRKQYGPRGR
jgi:hypothetical protein